MRLTRAGRRLVRHGRHVPVTVSFRHPPVAVDWTIRLRTRR
jgi:hypothetical protein